MGFSENAIRKGMSAEYLAKAHFSKKGFGIISSDTHEKPYDFIIDAPLGFLKVQVKAAILVKQGNFDLIRFRNKHGSENKFYKREDYDILAGVWVEKNKIALYTSDDVNSGEYGETISLCKTDGSPLGKRHRPTPYYFGDI